MRQAVFAVFLSALLSVATAEFKLASGEVEQITRVATIGAEAEPLLLLQLVDGRVFAFPGIEHVSAGRGVKVEIDYRLREDPGRVPEACAVRVIGLPLMLDGEEVMQSARHPVSIFVSDRAFCS